MSTGDAIRSLDADSLATLGILLLFVPALAVQLWRRAVELWNDRPGRELEEALEDYHPKTAAAFRAEALEVDPTDEDALEEFLARWRGQLPRKVTVRPAAVVYGPPGTMAGTGWPRPLSVPPHLPRIVRKMFRKMRRRLGGAL